MDRCVCSAEASDSLEALSISVMLETSSLMPCSCCRAPVLICFMASRRLFDGLGDLLESLGDLADDLAGIGRKPAAVLDLAGHALHRLLRFADERFDASGGFLGLVGQLADLRGHHGEAAALLAGAGRLDGGIQRQQLGLLGNLIDRRR